MPIQQVLQKSNQKILRLINKINSQEFVYFKKDDDVAALNKVMLYIQYNEHTKKIKVVAAFKKGEKATPQFITELDVIDREYPKIKIEFIQLEAQFGPELIRQLSEEWNIPVNFMFIGSPGDHFPYKIEQLGGVRLII